MFFSGALSQVPLSGFTTVHDRCGQRMIMLQGAGNGTGSALIAADSSSETAFSAAGWH